MLHQYFPIEGQRRGEYKPQRGFTAIELMVVVAILAILTALALPSFTETLKRYRVKRAAEDLVSMLQLARVESIKRGGNVTLRKSTASGCSAPTTQDWGCGWVLFVDSNNNGTQSGATEITLHQSLPHTGVFVNFGNSSASAKFDRWGQASGMGALGFVIQPDAGDASAPLEQIMAVCVSSGGRIRLLKETNVCP